MIMLIKFLPNDLYVAHTKKSTEIYARVYKYNKF